MRSLSSVLAIVVLLVLGLASWQEMRISSFKAELEQARLALNSRAERMATEKLLRHREEMVNAVAFLDELYRSPDGLMRPEGLFNGDARRVDAEAIGTWILDVYLQARIAGKSDAEARQSITDAIKGSDEWRLKHPK